MSFWEIFDFQCIYLTKLEYRTSLESLRTFIMIRDDMILCRCTYSSKWNIYQSLLLPWAFSISVPLSKKTNLHERFYTVKKHYEHSPWYSKQSRSRQTSLSSCYMFFWKQAIIADSESAMQNMPYRICRKLPLFLVINIWFGYR